jgi:hypothetical protein
MRMPKLDGIEAARRCMRNGDSDVMLTAFSDRAVVEKAIAAGVFAYLVNRSGDRSRTGSPARPSVTPSCSGAPRGRRGRCVPS